MWIGLLYSIMAFSTVAAMRTGRIAVPEDVANETADRYRSLARASMVLGDWSRCRPYTLECFIAYSGGEFLRNSKEPSTQVKTWALLGLVMRLSMRMGLHRDPSHYPNITPYNGEMRRRIWHFLHQIDVLLSFELGLPAMMKQIQSDTKLPRNLHDSDFSVDSPSLPAGRPTSELTTVSYPITKSSICSIFAVAADLSHALKQPSYEQIMQLDRELQENYSLIPPILRVRQTTQSITDSPSLIMSRFNIELMYQKTRCVLHRRYMTKSQQDQRYMYSRRTCIDAAMETLRHHADIWHATRPDGLLAQIRWYMSTLTTHDFVLAAMIICLELKDNGLAGRTAMEGPGIKPSERVYTCEDMMEALETSSRIWQSSEDEIPDAYKASEAMSIMIKKIKGEKGGILSHSLNHPASTTSSKYPSHHSDSFLFE